MIGTCNRCRREEPLQGEALGNRILNVCLACRPSVRDLERSARIVLLLLPDGHVQTTGARAVVMAACRDVCEHLGDLLGNPHVGDVYQEVACRIEHDRANKLRRIGGV